MSANVNPVPHHNEAITPADSAPSSAHAATAGAIASTQGGAGEANSKTAISSLNDLKKKAPELYNQMMTAFGMTICRQMQRHQDHLKKLMREATRNG